jgi:exopolysaccharide biosynthesis polyprenyl glycosylphosphotransferase
MKPQRIRKPLTAASSVRVPGRAPAWIIPSVKLTLVLLDLLIAASAFIVAFYLRQGNSILQPGTGAWHWTTQFAPYGALLPLIMVIRLLTLRYYDLYRLRGEFSFVDDAIAIFKAVSIGSLLIVAAAFLYRGGYQYRAFSYARVVFVIDFFLVLFTTTFLRATIRSGQILARRRGINLIPTLVVGRGREAAVCINEMRDRPALGYRVIGVVEPGSLQPDVPEMFEGVSLISDLAGLPEAIQESGANEVIIADSQVNRDALFEVMMRVGPGKGIEFRIAPSLFNCLPAKTEIDQIGALPMIRLFREPLSRESRLLKRACDAGISLLVMLVLSPLWLVIALLIKLDTHGPVFYVQDRVGMDGRMFRLYKFRTMRMGSADNTHREYQRKFIAGGLEANLGSADKPAYKLPADPRITRVGRWLRRTSLDEVPQFLNVLRGEMSVVGPRPPIAYEVEVYELWHRKRLDMKPGLTGLWQVSGRNRLPFEEMVKLDLFYIENWSLLLDLRIIFRTALVMFKGDGF